MAGNNGNEAALMDTVAAMFGIPRELIASPGAMAVPTPAPKRQRTLRRSLAYFRDRPAEVIEDVTLGGSTVELLHDAEATSRGYTSDSARAVAVLIPGDQYRELMRLRDQVAKLAAQFSSAGNCSSG